jgi:hypothetical protein
MNALKRFEDKVAQILEDRLGALLGGHVQPVDLARRVGEAMEDGRTLGAGRTYVPNVYRVYLAPFAFAGFASFQRALQEELAAYASRHAREAGYRLVGRPRVQLLLDGSLRPEATRVEADTVDAASFEGAGLTQAIEVAVPAGPTPSLAVVSAGRAALPLTGEAVTMGRALDNDLILEEATVSRHHARLVRRGDHWLLEDLGSTHGSYLNGHRVSVTLLRAGDEVRLGAAVLLLSADAPPLDADVPTPAP